MKRRGTFCCMTGLLLVAFAACGGAKRRPLVADSPTDLPDGAFSEAPATSDGGVATSTDSGAPSGAAILQGNEEGAQALLKQFVAPDADHAALTRSLRPTTADYKALFDAAAAAKIEATQAKEWNSGKAVIKPKPNQTEIKIWSATGAEIASGKPNAKEFPGGYKKLGKHLAAAVTFFRFKFVESGKDVGTAYDGLAFVNGHWVIAPKPWKAYGASKDDDEGASDEAPPPKPKTKPKKKKK